MCLFVCERTRTYGLCYNRTLLNGVKCICCNREHYNKSEICCQYLLPGQHDISYYRNKVWLLHLCDRRSVTVKAYISSNDERLSPFESNTFQRHNDVSVYSINRLRSWRGIDNATRAVATLYLTACCNMSPGFRTDAFAFKCVQKEGSA